MSITRNITATYRGPGRVVRHLLAMGPREDRALAYLMAACALLFIAQLPRLSREAHLTGEDLNMLMGGSLMALIFIAPLLLYGLALVARLIGRVLGGQGTGYGARLALFWALLASAPLLLLHGLVSGFIGPGPQETAVGLLWFVAFLWFWIGGSIAQERAT
ncbi:YIP1 family protein [uncultured Tateyamaria sp.]|uniref:YIP1 family protein n=1 Tax=uncultured Tateyamaria sp. TaxID=455651 RepID=UPI0026224F26|nr:YIP1 family protein [uncultured Tateyamaria sp.]